MLTYTIKTDKTMANNKEHKLGVLEATGSGALAGYVIGRQVGDLKYLNRVGKLKKKLDNYDLRNLKYNAKASTMKMATGLGAKLRGGYTHEDIKKIRGIDYVMNTWNQERNRRINKVNEAVRKLSEANLPNKYGMAGAGLTALATYGLYKANNNKKSGHKNNKVKAAEDYIDVEVVDSHKQHLLDNPHKTPGAGNTTKPKVNKAPIMHRLKVGTRKFFRKHGGKVAAGTAIAGLAIPAGIELYNHVKSAEQHKGKTMNDLKQHLSIVANEIYGFGAYNVMASKARPADDLHQMAGTAPKKSSNKKPVKDFRKKTQAANTAPKATVNDVPKVNKVEIKQDTPKKSAAEKSKERNAKKNAKRQTKQNKPANNKTGAPKQKNTGYSLDEMRQHVSKSNNSDIAEKLGHYNNTTTSTPKAPASETKAAKDGMLKRAGKFLSKHKGKAAIGAAGTGALGYIGYRNGRDS